MDQINNKELLKINGGGVGLGVLIGIGVVFLIGVLDGYVRPLSCR